MNSGSGKSVPVVGIGASAGGIEAFRIFFEKMPCNSGLGFVVILHLPSDRKSLLPEILSRWTPMQVVAATDGCLVEANCVYVPPAGVVVTLQNGHLHTHAAVAAEPRELTPINVFFNSLATELGEDAIGIVLSGTGYDGSLGLKAIKALGGLTLAQGEDGTTPQFDGMPESAIAIGAVDIVAPVEAMPIHIIEVQAARWTPDEITALSTEQLDADRLAICAVLRQQIEHDFSGYKEKTFLRRVQRRMHVLGLAKIADYIARLKKDQGEVNMLFRDLLIGVTSFFRDVETFEVLKHNILPRLFTQHDAVTALRIWVPACATGEEAYTLAMLIREYADSCGDTPPKIQIFATDINESAIATARTGRYPSSLLQELAPERLARFFVKGNDGSYTIAKELRDLCIFSVHSITRDPPFSKVNLVSCRNLLIYLDSDLQAVVIPAFHYALVPDGILLLGRSETIARHENLFDALDKQHRIFQRRDVPSPPLHLSGKRNTPMSAIPGGWTPKSTPARGSNSKMNNRACTRVLEKFAPAFVVVNVDGEIIQYSSGTGRFLEPAPGLPSQNIMYMARQGLRVPLRLALKEAAAIGQVVEKRNISAIVADGSAQKITIVVEPLMEHDSSTVYLVVFVESGEFSTAPKIEHVVGGLADPDLNSHLEAELRDTREQLQSVSEEHDTAVEELRSANEELHSVNEELQSANEELETSKEEIQAINEELQTVNSELASKVEELDRRNSDLKNLFDSTQVATIFLDQYFIIRGFTPAVASIYNLIPTDQGRPLTDIVSRLQYDGLRDDVHKVLATLEPLERRVVRDDGETHYLMRILPYRTPESTVDGSLVTFVDVTSIVQAEQHQRLLVDELNHRVKNMLTVIISIATQTMRNCQSLDEFSANYMGRIHALSTAYSLLSAEEWQTVSLRTLLMEELEPFVAPDRANLIVQGPQILLEPRAALALGMAIHELTTNAVKYGALSVPEGNVTISWRVENGSHGDKLYMDWVETDGPPVVAPTHRGFGTLLIERGLKEDMGAEVDMEFSKSGVRATFSAPLKTGTTTVLQHPTTLQ